MAFFNTVSCRPSLTMGAFWLRCGATIVALSAISIAASQTILRGSEKVVPGEPLNVIGDSFDTSASVSAAWVDVDGTVGTPVNLPVITRTSSVIQATVPTTLPLGLWQIQVTNSDGGVSNSIFVNKIRPMVANGEEVLIGGNLRVFGRNMMAVGQSSPAISARFIDPDGNAIAASIRSYNQHSITVIVPSSLSPGTAYRVILNNGSGGPLGDAECPWPVTAVSWNDPFGTGLGWTADIKFANNVYNIKTDSRLPVRATGDGVADDTQALFWAIDTAWHAGGGVVYMPAGAYRVNGPSTNIMMRPNVIIKGDGIGQTTLQYGYRYTALTPAPAGDAWMIMTRATRAGLVNMTIQNMNTGPVPNGQLQIGLPGAVTGRILLKNVDFELGNGSALSINCADRVLVDNCIINSLSTRNGAFGIVRCRNLNFSRNRVAYRVGRCQVQMGDRYIIEGSTFTRDTTFDVPGSIESGGLETSYGRDVVVYNNTINTSGLTPTKGDTDGEALGSQKGIVNDFEDVGRAESATETTITDTNKTWPSQSFQSTSYTGFNRAIVAIVAGKGVGQWRLITGHTTNTLTLDQPWEIIPDSTSVYSIGSWSSDTHMYLVNRISGGHVGISVYDGGWDTVIDGNIQTNTGAMMLRTCSRYLGMNNWSQYRVGPMWNLYAANNQVLNLNRWRIAQLVVESVDASGTSYGSIHLGSEVRGNLVVGADPMMSTSTQWGDTEGLWNSCIVVGNTSATGISNTGTLFSRNSARSVPSAVNVRGPMVQFLAR